MGEEVVHDVGQEMYKQSLFDASCSLHFDLLDWWPTE